MHEKYTFKEYIGVGVYSEVRKAVDNFTQDHVAIKILKKSYMKKEERAALRFVLDNSECNEHKNITKLIEYYQDKKFYYMIYEYNQGGLLFDYIWESLHYDEKMVASIIKQVVSALIYNQGQGKEIFHKDIRPENLMIEDPLLDIPALKINDFSTSIEFKPKDKKIRKFRKMTFSCLYYVPPEVLDNIGYNDIWSVGIIMYILLTGTNPLKGLSNKVTLKNIKSKDLKIDSLVKDKVIDQEAGNLLKRMLERDPKKRWTNIEALNDQWVIKYSKNESMDSSVTEETKEKFTELWNLYYLQVLWMRYFGVHSLDSMNIELVKQEAETQGISEDDMCSYDQLYKILLIVNENSIETIKFELQSIFTSMGIKGHNEEIKLSDFLSSMWKVQLEFCQLEIEKRFALLTARTDGKISWDKIRAILVEREDSIAPNWNKVLSKLGLKNSDEANFEYFMKIYKLFRLEEA
jgi:calcium-dependent protein kinase